MERAQELVASDLQTADSAIVSACEEQAAMLSQIDDPYLSERAIDLRDVGQRAARIARGAPSGTDLSHIASPAIVLADDLTPSETVRLDREHVLGLALSGGGPTSHVAVVARSLGVPLIVGMGQLPNGNSQDTTALLDGDRGVLVLNPSIERVEEYRGWRDARRSALAMQDQLRDLPAKTQDGATVRLVANAGSVAEAREAARFGAEGIGLLRTEFFSWTTIPTEGEQTDIYSQVFAAMQGREVVVRTMDLGGDKPPPYLDFGNEANPFLGWRGLRIALDRPEMLRTQLRAVLRAGAGGTVLRHVPHGFDRGRVQESATTGAGRQARAGRRRFVRRRGS